MAVEINGRLGDRACPVPPRPARARRACRRVVGMRRALPSDVPRGRDLEEARWEDPPRWPTPYSD